MAKEKGQVISGKFGEIKARQKAGEEIELGELLVSDTPKGKNLMQVYDLQYGSQISDQNLELISGMQLEEDADLNFMDPKLRNYTVAFMKSLISIRENDVTSAKSLPPFFSTVRQVEKDDLKFLTEPDNPLYLGKLRSGTKELDVPLYLPGEKVFSHHVLITGTTGKGKSVLMSNLLWDATKRDYASTLVLDPHDEYYGRNDDVGLKDHPKKDNVEYYTSQKAPPGGKNLVLNLDVLKPQHFQFLDLSSAQRQAMNAYYKNHGENWIEEIIKGEDAEDSDFYKATLSVLKRRMNSLLDISYKDGELYCNGVFKKQGGESTLSNIIDELESEKTVIIDTSNFSGQVELLVGSLIATELFNRYRYFKRTGDLDNKPAVSIVLEEAPRVLGKEVLENGSNIFSSIAREGRKFNVGLSAITQLPSLIPREILANMNTKIILGTEMNTERQAIIESASQDLSSDDRTIASLDKGEALVSSNFAKFALPLSIPYFPELAKEDIENSKEENVQKSFEGM